MRKNNRLLGLASLLVVAGLSASASADVIYSDTFSGAAGTVLGGNAPAVANGIAGGTAGATWNAATTTVAAGSSSTTDADWLYSGSNSVTITSPTTSTARDTALISNAVLPFTPQAGYVYDLEATISVPSTTDNHWVGLAYVQGTLNGHTATGQALSNDNPTGLVIVRDGPAATTSPNYVDIFEGAAGGTGGDTQFAPSATSLTGGTVGSTPITVDIILNEDLASPTISWLLNGISVGAPVTLSGSPSIGGVSFGDDTSPLGTVTNFSLTTIPEPASLGLVGLGGLLAMRRRRHA